MPEFIVLVLCRKPYAVYWECSRRRKDNRCNASVIERDGTLCYLTSCQITDSRGTRGPSIPTCKAASLHCGMSTLTTLRKKGPLLPYLLPVQTCMDQQSASDMDL